MGEGTRIYDTEGNYTVFGLLGRNLLGSELACLSGLSGNIETRLNAVENLSADEIAVLLGYANAAAMVEAIGQYCVAGGTVNAITLTVPDWTEVDGAKLSFRASGGNSGAVTIAVNGGTARDLRKSSQASGIGALNGGELLGLHTVQWDSANSIFRLLNYRTTKEDIPSTLNATTIGTVLIAYVGGQSFLQPAPAISGSFLFCGGQAGGYSKIELFSADHATKPGDVEYYTGSAAGAVHSFFDKNGVEQLKIDENGPIHGQSAGFFGTHGNGGLRNYLSNSYSTAILGGTSSGNGGAIRAFGNDSANIPGGTEMVSRLRTRAASTAFTVGYCATGGVIRSLIMDDAAASTHCWATVNSDGSVSFSADTDAKYVNSSSPAAGEIGVYLSASYLQCKPGSSFTGKISTHSFSGE